MYTYKILSEDDIGRRLDCSQWVISDRLRQFGIKTRPKTYNLSHRKYTYNKNFLNDISSDTAWILGLLVSDGFVRKNNLSGYFGLSLKREDEDVVFKVKNMLKYTGPVYKGMHRLTYKGRTKEFSYSLLQINGIETVKKMEQLGILQNKTLRERFLTCIKDTKDEEKISNFIRGIYEGDGSILFDNKRNSSCFQIVGTRCLLQVIQTYLMHYGHLNKTKLTQNISGTNHFALRYRGNLQVIKILEWIYKYSNPTNRMDRKFNKFNEIRRAVGK